MQKDVGISATIGVIEARRVDQRDPCTSWLVDVKSGSDTIRFRVKRVPDADVGISRKKVDKLYSESRIYE